MKWHVALHHAKLMLVFSHLQLGFFFFVFFLHKPEEELFPSVQQQSV